METCRRVHAGVAAILARDGRILVGRRINSHGEGTWSVPGGHPEFGEATAHTAIRETLEETGLVLLDPIFAAVTNDVQLVAGTHYVTTWMMGRCPLGTPRLMEPGKFVDHRWVSLDGLPSPMFWPWQQLLASPFIDSIREWVDSTRVMTSVTPQP